LNLKHFNHFLKFYKIDILIFFANWYPHPISSSRPFEHRRCWRIAKLCEIVLNINFSFCGSIERIPIPALLSALLYIILWWIVREQNGQKAECMLIRVKSHQAKCCWWKLFFFRIWSLLIQIDELFALFMLFSFHSLHVPSDAHRVVARHRHVMWARGENIF
jgi:hypothetical protein